MWTEWSIGLYFVNIYFKLIEIYSNLLMLSWIWIQYNFNRIEADSNMSKN